MPSADTICIFGDSHLGAAKRAVDEGLVPDHAAAIRFWGAAGPAFRGLRMKGGRIVPDPASAEAVAQVRGEGPETLGPGDFKRFVFYGARMRLGDLVKEMHDYERQTGPVSAAVLRLAVRQWLARVRSYRFAQVFAAAGAEVAFVPTSLPTAGVIDPLREAELFHVPRAGGLAERCGAAVEDLGREAGVRFVLQPEDTITEQSMTRGEFATERAVELGDVVHKSPAFAALMLHAALGGAPARAKARAA